MTLGPRDIRTRLALGYAVAVALTVVVYAVVVYTFSRSSLLDQLDARLRADFEAAEHAFEVAADGTLSWLDEGSHGGGHDTSGESPWVEVTAGERAAPLRRPHVVPYDAGPFRTYAADYVVDGTPTHIRVGRSTAAVDGELRTLLLLLAGSLLPVVGLAYIGGRLLARRALAPVEAMTERARTISAAALSERLPVANPDDELGRLATVFNEAFGRIERSFEQLRRFTSDAAHELRTPLAALRSVGEVGVSAERDAEAYREVVGSMLEEADRLAVIVDDLLTLSRADAGADVLELAPVPLLDVARAVCDQLEILAHERGQTLEVGGDEHVRVSADAPVLRRALTNLVDNAIQYSPDGAGIQVVVGTRGADAIVEVQDAGPGIAPADHAQIFERFFRGDRARTGRGTGLGLSIARWAVERHGGRIEVESATGAGSTFRIVLPRG